MKWRKKPVVIEAVQWKATQKTWEEISNLGCPTKPGEIGSESFLIPTLEGDMKCSKNDYVIKGVNGEFNPCKPDIFQKTYEPADESPSISEGEEAIGQQEIWDEIDEIKEDQHPYAALIHIKAKYKLSKK